MVIKVHMSDDEAHETINEITEVIERYQEGPDDEGVWEEIAGILCASGVKVRLSPASKKRLYTVGFENEPAFGRLMGG